MNDELTHRLSRQLHDQVDDWQAAPLTLEGVQGRARSIRRTRRVAAGAVVAAVFAIVVPVGIVAGGVLDASPDRDVPPANSPTEAVETEPSALGIPYLEGRTLTMPDGSRTELPRAYDGAAVLDGADDPSRVLAISIDTDDGSTTLDRIEGGEVVGTEDLASMELASNDDGSAVAYVRADGQLVVEGIDGQVEVADVGRSRPVALLGGPDCTDEDCVVFLDQDGAPVTVSGSGDVTGVSGDPLAVADASAAAGRVAMLMSVDDFEPSSCSRVVSNDASQGTVFETCTYTLDAFSQDGSYLRAGPSYRSGIGDSFVSILDGDTGDQLARFAPENGFVSDAVWEDAEHLLVLTHDWTNGEWSVVRLGADRSTETALGPVAGGEMKPPWQLVGAR